MLDLAEVRAQFPALANAHGFILFDNAGGSQILGSAAARVAEFYATSNVQLGGSYALSQLAGERVADGARAVARWLGCDAAEVALGTSTTQLLANLSLAMARQIAPGDEIVVTDVDHESNIGPWRRLAAMRGATIKEWRADADTLCLRAEDLAALLTDKTRLVAFTHASNLVGSVHDVAALTHLVHSRGARVVVDGVAFAPHRPLDVRGWDVDYYVFSVYKTYGPHLACLYGKRALLDALDGVNHYFIADTPYKLQPGHVPYELAAALPAVVDYLAALDFDDVAAHERALGACILNFLDGTRGVRVLGEKSASPTRLPTISFTVDGADDAAAASIVREVDRHKIGIKSGDFYARRLVDRLGLTSRGGVVRASLVHYNTIDEAERLCAVLAPILTAARAG
ncbi:MAG TPA: cysteine desulfurase-like protein [Polyangia bacterium]|jgi:cysteine desulfurase family protein (TIGR01976 family)